MSIKQDKSYEISFYLYQRLYIYSKGIVGILLILLSNTTEVIANSLLEQNFLRKIWYEFSVGGGMDFYKTTVEPSMVLAKNNGNFFRKEKNENEDNEYLYAIAHWPYGPLVERYLDEEIEPSFFTNTQSIAFFKGSGMHIPLTLLSMLDFFKLRMGIGIGINFNFLLKQLTYQLNKKFSNTQKNTHFFIKSKKMCITFYPIIMLGFILKKYENNIFLSDFQFTPMLYIFKLASTHHLFIRINNFQISLITWENKLSPYCKIATKLGYYIEQQSTTESPLQVHRKNSIILHFGISFKMPDFPSCPYKQCRVKRDHKHNEKIYSRFYIM